MLFEKIERAKVELEAYKLSSEIVDLFERISQIVMSMTSRSVEAISTSLR